MRSINRKTPCHLTGFFSVIPVILLCHPRLDRGSSLDITKGLSFSFYLILPLIKHCHLLKKGGTKISSLEKMYYRYRSFKKPRLNSSSSLYSDSSNSKLGHILEFTHLLRTFSKACYIQYKYPLKSSTLHCHPRLGRGSCEYYV